MSEQYNEPQVTERLSFSHFSMNRNGRIAPSETDQNAERIILEQIALQKAAILALDSDTDRLDMQRIEKSGRHFGMSEKPMVFLNSVEYAQILKDVGSTSKEPSGIYIEGLGISLIQRDVTLEALNGPELTESFAIHEGAHSTHTKSKLQLIRKRGIFGKSSFQISPTPRVYGMTDDNCSSSDYGSLYEEGYAELERGLYVQEHGLVEQFTHNASNLAIVKESPVPLHYTYQSGSLEADTPKTLTFAPGALGAAVFDILIKESDNLLPALRKGRHDREGLRESAELIDGLEPGLYDAFQRATSQESMISILVTLLKKYK